MIQMTTTTATRTAAAKGKGKAATASKGKAPSKAQQSATTAKGKADNAVAMETLVKAFNTALGQEREALASLDTIRAGLATARVQAGRAAYAIFTHPDTKERYATAAKSVGMPRNTLRRYIDAGKALAPARRSATDVTDADRTKVSAIWEKEAAQKLEERQAQAELAKANAPKDSDGKPVKKAALKPKDGPVTTVTVHKALDEALAVAKTYTKDQGFTAKQSEALLSKLAELSAMIEGATAKG